MTIFYAILFFIIFMAFLYFGYRDDYRRDKNGFKRIILGILGSTIILLISFYVKKEITILSFCLDISMLTVWGIWLKERFP
jgi:hypothetical protein